MQLAQNARVDQLRKQQLEIEDQKRKYELINQINPATLSEKFDTEVVNQSLAGMRTNLKEYLKNNPSSFELQSHIQDELTKLATWNSKVKAVRERIDSGLKSFNMKGFDKGAIQAIAIDKALHKDVNGQKVLKSPDEISLDEDYLGAAVSDDRAVNYGETYDMLNDWVKDMHANPITEKRTVVVQRGKKKEYERQDVSYPSFMQWDDQKGSAQIRGTDIKDDNGNVVGRMIADDIYQNATANPALNSLMTREAKRAMEASGATDLNNAAALELHKKAWLSNYLTERAGIKTADEKRDIVLPPTRVKVEKSDDEKRDKEYEILPKVMGGILQLDPSVLADGEPSTNLKIDNTPLIRVDHLFNGGQFNMMVDGRKQPVPVYVHPKKPNRVYIGDADDPSSNNLTPYSGSALGSLIIKSAELNGSDVKTVKKMLGLGSTAASKIK